MTADLHRLAGRFAPAEAAYRAASEQGRDVASARAGSEELVAVAAELDRPYLRAMGADATEVATLAAGDARGALLELRAAWTAWRRPRGPLRACAHSS